MNSTPVALVVFGFMLLLAVLLAVFGVYLGIESFGESLGGR